MVAAIRATDVSDSAGAGSWRPGRPCRHASWGELLTSVGDDPPDGPSPGWSAALAASETGDSALHAALEELGRLAADGVGEGHRTLLHADLLNRNVHARDGRVTGVFDWGCAAIGDPLYEMAWFDVWAPWHPPMAGAGVAAALLADMERRGESLHVGADRLRAARLHILCDSITYCAPRPERHAQLRRLNAQLVAALEG